MGQHQAPAAQQLQRLINTILSDPRRVIVENWPGRDGAVSQLIHISADKRSLDIDQAWSNEAEAKRRCLMAENRLHAEQKGHKEERQRRLQAEDAHLELQRQYALITSTPAAAPTPLDIRMFQTQCPLGAGPGDTVPVIVDGAQFTVIVPQGINAGQMFMIRMPPATSTPSPTVVANPAEKVAPM